MVNYPPGPIKAEWKILPAACGKILNIKTHSLSFSWSVWFLWDKNHHIRLLVTEMVQSFFNYLPEPINKITRKGVSCRSSQLSVGLFCNFFTGRWQCLSFINRWMRCQFVDYLSQCSRKRKIEFTFFFQKLRMCDGAAGSSQLHSGVY